MKKRIFSIALALVMLLALAVPALAAEEPEPTPEPEYRLVKVVNSQQGCEFTFAYGQGGYLPTEMLKNGATYVTASYDEDGRATAFQDDYRSVAFAYDETGNCVRSESTYDYGDGPSTTVIEYTYDDDGNRIREDETGTGSDTYVTEYTYDEDSNCVREDYTSTGNDGAVTTSVTEYAYDEDGNCVREEYTRTKSDGAESTEVTEYTYDGEGRMLSEVTTEDGESSEATYTYGEDGRCTKTDGNGNTRIEYDVPLLEVYWQDWTYDNSDGTSYTINQCDLMLLDNTEYVDILYTYCTCDGEPTLTYDDNGCLVRVDGAAGNSIELTYEPVA